MNFDKILTVPPSIGPDVSRPQFIYLFFKFNNNSLFIDGAKTQKLVVVAKHIRISKPPLKRIQLADFYPSVNLKNTLCHEEPCKVYKRDSSAHHVYIGNKVSQS